VGGGFKSNKQPETLCEEPKPAPVRDGREEGWEGVKKGTWKGRDSSYSRWIEDWSPWRKSARMRRFRKRMSTGKRNAKLMVAEVTS